MRIPYSMAETIFLNLTNLGLSKIHDLAYCPWAKTITNLCRPNLKNKYVNKQQIAICNNT